MTKVYNKRQECRQKEKLESERRKNVKAKHRAWKFKKVRFSRCTFCSVSFNITIMWLTDGKHVNMCYIRTMYGTGLNTVEKHIHCIDGFPIGTTERQLCDGCFYFCLCGCMRPETRQLCVGCDTLCLHPCFCTSSLWTMRHPLKEWVCIADSQNINMTLNSSNHHNGADW